MVDAVIMRVVDFMLGFPSILIALVLLASIGRGVDKVILAIVLVQWAQYARLMRASALVERRKEYIEAALNFGLPTRHIMIAHLLPNSVGSVLVVASISIASAITLEATLSFLGVGEIKTITVEKTLMGADASSTALASGIAEATAMAA